MLDHRRVKQGPQDTRVIRSTPGSSPRDRTKASTGISSRSVLAEMETAALPPAGIFWLTVRILAPASAKAASMLDRTPGRSRRTEWTVRI